MICPLDLQPCTGDHSQRCADECYAQRRAERVERLTAMGRFICPVDDVVCVNCQAGGSCLMPLGGRPVLDKMMDKSLKVTTSPADGMSMTHSMTIEITRTEELFRQSDPTFGPELIVYSTNIRGRIWVEETLTSSAVVIPANEFKSTFGDAADRRQDEPRVTLGTVFRQGGVPLHRDRRQD